MSNTVTIEIKDHLGLHAKKCLEACKAAQKYTSSISVEHNGFVVDAKSILGLMSLCVPYGDDVVIRANGNDSQLALNALLPIIQ